MIIGKEEMAIRLLQCDEDSGLNGREQASLVINNLIGIITEALQDGDFVRLSGIGTLKSVVRPTRKGTSF